MNTKADNQTYFIPAFEIQPAYNTGTSTLVDTYRVVDQAGNNWHYGTYNSCKEFIKFYLIYNF